MGELVYEIRKDGEVVQTDTAVHGGDAIDKGAVAGHRMFSYSWDHAERYEGYALYVGPKGGRLNTVRMRS